MIKVTTIGFDKLSNRLQTVGKAMRDEVQAEVEASAMQFVALAKKDLASQGGDRGTLLKSISYKKETKYSYLVYANAFYAPFIEFGTKNKYRPYPGTEQFAAQYRNIKGNGDWIDMLKNIYSWVKRKGIGITYSVKTKRKDTQTSDQRLSIAFAITMSILRNGISPKPFFFKQIPVVQKSLNQRITNLLNGI